MTYVDSLDPAAPASRANTMPTGGTWNGPLSQQPLAQRLRRTSSPTIDAGVSSRTAFLRNVAQQKSQASQNYQKMADQATAFNGWYGGLSPEAKAQFAPQTHSPLLPGTSLGRFHAVGPTGKVTDDVTDNTEGVTRQTAWEHFKTLPQPQAGEIPIGSPAGPTPSGAALPGGAGIGGPAARPSLPISLTPQTHSPLVTQRVQYNANGTIKGATETTTTGRPGPASRPAPAGRTPQQNDADAALAAQRTATAAAATAATQPGGKDFEAGKLAAARAAATTQPKPGATTKPAPTLSPAGQLTERRKQYNEDPEIQKQKAAFIKWANGDTSVDAPVRTPFAEWDAAHKPTATQPATMDPEETIKQMPVYGTPPTDPRIAPGGPMTASGRESPITPPATAPAPVQATPATSNLAAHGLPPNAVMNPDGTATVNGIVYRKKPQ